MKKILIVVIAAVLLMNIFGGDSAKASSMDFVSIDRQFRNGQFIVKGHLLNNETDKSITGIKNGYILLCDVNGKVRNKVALDASLKHCTIGPSGSLAYSFVMDASKVKFDYAYDIYFDVEAKCTFGKGVNLPAPAPVPKPNPDDENRYRCSWCYGSGVCEDCNGTRKNPHMEGSIWESLGCTLCKSTGKCYKCGGDGLSAY